MSTILNSNGMLIRLVILFLLLLFNACSNVDYLYNASVNQIKILAARKNLSKLIAIDSTSADLTLKLKLIQASRDFADKNKIAVGQTYSSVALLKSQQTIWVIMATNKNSFKLYFWDYPIVGRTPYKGFFDKTAAEKEIINLANKSFEADLRSSAAFSTLGWFDDPILPSMLALEPVQLTNTIFHELVHKQIWLKDRVALNESLANLVGYEMNLLFYRELYKNALEAHSSGKSTLLSLEQAKDFYFQSLNQQQQLLPRANKIRLLRSRLIRKNSQQALTNAARQKILRHFKITEPISNAEIMQERIYHTGMRELKACYQLLGSNTKLFAFIKRKAKLKHKKLFPQLRACQTRIAADEW